jgi:hypothetical protein
MAKLDAHTANEILKATKTKGKDFHTLHSSDVEALLTYAKKHKYRKDKSAPGSTGRMFHQHLTRLASKVNEDTLTERNRRLRRKGFLRNRSKALDGDGNLVAKDGNIKGKVVKEETLTELSKGTLKSYLIKAMDSRDAEYHASDDSFNRSQDKGNSKEYRKKQLSLSKFHARKYDRRNKGIRRATDKFLNKEDLATAINNLTEEQFQDFYLDLIYEHSVEEADQFLAELSKKTLNSYAVKANRSEGGAKPNSRVWNNRVNGINNAEMRLGGKYSNYKKYHREDVQPLNELSKKTLNSYLDKTTKYQGQVYDRDVDLKVAKRREEGRVKAQNRKNGVMNDKTKPRYHNGFNRLKKYRAD